MTREARRIGEARRIAARLSVAVGAACLAALPAAGAPALRVVALSGEAAPGAGIADVFDSFQGTALPVLDPSGRVAFTATLAGPSVSAANDEGLWSEGSGVLELVAREGAGTPGLALGIRFGSFFDPVLDAAGDIAFVSTLSGPGVGVDGDEAVWSSVGGTLEPVAVSGGAAPGTEPGVRFSDISVPLTLSRSGTIGFLSKLTGLGVVTSLNDGGAWSGSAGNLVLVGRSGTPAPGAGAGALFQLFGPLNLAPGDRLGFQGSLFGPAVDPGNDGAIWFAQGGPLFLLVRESDPAPDTGGASLGALSTPSFDGSGRFAFYSVLTGPGVDSSNDRAVWVGQGATPTLVVRKGEPAPGAGASVFADFLQTPVLNAAGQVAFEGRLTGPAVDASNDGGLWSQGGGPLDLVAREGDPAPGAAPAVWADFLLFGFDADGDMAFLAMLTGTGVTSANDMGLWRTVRGVPELVAREGDAIEVAPSDLRTVASLGFRGNSGNADGRRSAYSDRGVVAFSAVFTDASEAVLAAPEAGGAASVLAALMALAPLGAARRRAARRRAGGRAHR